MCGRPTAFSLTPELAARLEALRPQLTEFVAACPQDGNTVLVVVLSREAREGRSELVTQFRGVLHLRAARRVVAKLAPSLAPLLREAPPARSVWCLMLGPRKALVAFPV